MQLVSFAAQKGSGSIRADDLDQNFRQLQPMATDGSARTYSITSTPDGWLLTIYPDNIVQQGLSQIFNSEFPSPPGSGTYVLGAVGGQLAWIGTENCAT